MVHKKLFTYLTIIMLCSYQNSWSTSFDYYPYFDNGIIVPVPPLSLKHIALYALSDGLKSIFPKTAVYTFGLVGCLMGGKLLYSAILHEMKQSSIDMIDSDEDLKEEIKPSTPKKTSTIDSQPCPYAREYFYC